MGLIIHPTYAALNRPTTNVPSACRIANTALNDVMILSYETNPDRTEFSEGTPLLVTYGICFTVMPMPPAKGGSVIEPTVKCDFRIGTVSTSMEAS